MSTRLGNWIIVFGAVVLFAGLCILPSAFGKNPDSSLLPLGACFFSLGAVMIAGGIYLKANSIQKYAAMHEIQPPAIARKQRGGCDLCGPEAPVVLCKTHQLHMCGNCLAQHYDLRSCIYIPSSRKTAVNPNKPARAKARGA